MDFFGALFVALGLVYLADRVGDVAKALNRIADLMSKPEAKKDD
jgi:hypothetical protein